jgi:hypothetical protein
MSRCALVPQYYHSDWTFVALEALRENLRPRSQGLVGTGRQHARGGDQVVLLKLRDEYIFLISRPATHYTCAVFLKGGPLRAHHPLL